MIQALLPAFAAAGEMLGASGAALAAGEMAAPLMRKILTAVLGSQKGRQMVAKMIPSLERAAMIGKASGAAQTEQAARLAASGESKLVAIFREVTAAEPGALTGLKTGIQTGKGGSAKVSKKLAEVDAVLGTGSNSQTKEARGGMWNWVKSHPGTSALVGLPMAGMAISAARGGGESEGNPMEMLGGGGDPMKQAMLMAVMQKMAENQEKLNPTSGVGSAMLYI